jgi:hypothetical protein
MKAIWIFIGVVVAGGLALVVSWLRRYRASRELRPRESLDDEAIYASYYAESNLPKALVLQLWHEVAETLKVPASQLRPGDRFGK